MNALTSWNSAPLKLCAGSPKLYEGVVHYTVNIGNASASFRWEGPVTRISDGAAFHYEEDQQDVFQQGSGTTKSVVSAIRLEEASGHE